MYQNLSYYTIVFILGIIVGSLLALPLLYATVWLAWGPKQMIKLRFYVNPKLIIQVFFEEIIWRTFPCFLMLSESLSSMRCLLLVIILSLLFVLAHKLYSVRDFIERLCFTLVLYIGAMAWPGINFGLHLGRNVWTTSVFHED